VNPPDASTFAAGRDGAADRAAEHAAVDRALAYVRDWLPYRYPRADVPGYAVAVAHRGAVLLEQACGWADLEAREPLRTDHVFRVASHSKTFTAAAVLRLVEQGRLGLDDRVADHLDWVSGHRDPRMGLVTVRQLLSHGAGIIRDGVDADFWQLRRPFPDGPALRAEILGADLVTDTNLALKYSNFGYGLLGQLIEAVAGETYGDHVRRALIEPLGLASTGPEPDSRTGLPMAVGYGRPDAEGTRQPLPAVDTGALAPATGFYATAADLARWFSALCLLGGTFEDPPADPLADPPADAGAAGQGRPVRRPGQAKAGALARQLLGDEAKKEMRRPHWRAERPGQPDAGDEHYGLGLMLDRVANRAVIGHSGGFPGFITRSFADPSTGLVVVALTNAIDGPATQIAKGILGVLDTFLTKGGRPERSRLRLEGRYAGLWGVLDVVATEDGLLVGSGDSWEPLAGPERLAPMGPGGRTFRIAEASSSSSPGETVTFLPARGPVQSVRYAGTTAWPEEVWRTEGPERLLAPPSPPRR